ncbi:MAG: sulfotransferase [Bacteroidales bacterium]|nr:sulfotransferase [Bacteroidales bacterium]
MKKDIIVTGSHRSGSTWVGNVLCATGELLYIHEPFNPINIKTNRAPLNYWFEYLSADDNTERQESFMKYLKEYKTFRPFMLPRQLLQTEKLRDYAGLILQQVRKLFKERAVYKDPIAIFSAEWMYEIMNFDIVVIIRHPAAFTQSLKSVGWFHDFTHFTQQEKLMVTIPSVYQNDIDRILSDGKMKANIIEHAVLLWNIIHNRIHEYRQKHPEWIFVRHEDLSNNPVELFAEIYNKLEINFSNRARSYIKKTTESSRQSKLKRDSRSNITKWKKMLSEEEIEFIREKTKSVSDLFYNNSDW